MMNCHEIKNSISDFSGLKMPFFCYTHNKASWFQFCHSHQKSLINTRSMRGFKRGDNQIRTGDDGVADRSLSTWLCRHIHLSQNFFCSNVYIIAIELYFVKSFFFSSLKKSCTASSASGSCSPSHNQAAMYPTDKYTIQKEYNILQAA